ncbi:helix-turn-helix domain-containing protein [Stagnihabitans tardus]|uniref:Replication protein C n=1 Tax=Stagnihabitans tardus TaxID=2699202 RepID=A0AAE4YGC4_9RHOB|nr:helix-turn-helix domain-containing protein [Stagnihabitans tardus]NBZ89220.1 replication protein C [Stagnihabitans tardus]
MKHVLGTSPAVADCFSTSIRISYELLAPVKVLRKELGLTPNDIAVLTALISFAPRDKAQPTALTIVFPSNEVLSERANGLDERTIRRCIARLVSAGLIARKTSANRKRFPLRFGGAIRDAFGFDLLPLVKDHDTLCERAKQVSQLNQDLVSLRSKALALRAAAMHAPNLSPGQLEILATARNTLRRMTLTVDQATATIGTIEQILRSTGSDKSAEQDKNVAPDTVMPDELTATDGQNVRHIDASKKELKTYARAKVIARPYAGRDSYPMNKETDHMEWRDFKHVACFFPEEPSTRETFKRTLFELGKVTRVTHEKLMQAMRHIAPGRILLAFDCLLAKGDSIRNPEGYFHHLLAT